LPQVRSFGRHRDRATHVDLVFAGPHPLERDSDWVCRASRRPASRVATAICGPAILPRARSRVDG
jgi:hypothetical protein